MIDWREQITCVRSQIELYFVTRGVGHIKGEIKIQMPPLEDDVIRTYNSDFFSVIIIDI